MRRRSFLTVTASATALGIAGCVQEPGDRENSTDANPETSAQDGPGSQPEGTESPSNGTEDPSETAMPDSDSPTDEGTETEEETPTDGHGSSAQAWGSSGRMNGVTFSFTSHGPETGENRDVADITRDDDTGEVIVDGTISGNDSCKRAKLGSVEYDEGAGTLTVDVETTNIEGCEMAAQALVGIDYEGTFEVDGELPSEIQVTHEGRSVASASYASETAAAPPTTDST